METMRCFLVLALVLFAGAGPLLTAEVAAPVIVSLSLPYPKLGTVERLDPALDEVLSPEATMEKVAEGFAWAEGPVWLPRKGMVVFSDIPRNTAYQWRESVGAKVFLHPSGNTGLMPSELGEGSNGLALDRQGRLLLCQHSDRRIALLNEDGHSFSTVVDRFEGRRFNSPNDLCVDRHGNLYFTDPPYGLGKNTKPELEFNGVFRRATDGTLTLISREQERPNGLALSPDEKILYVANSHMPRLVIMAYDLSPDGTAGPGRVFFNATALRAQGRTGGLDGMKVDVRGNLWATGPGGVLIISPAGKHLGTLLTGRAAANCCFGGPSGSTLYITAKDTLCRIETKTTGAGL
jgi:gluconolactonase